MVHYIWEFEYSDRTYRGEIDRRKWYASPAAIKEQTAKEAISHLKDLGYEGIPEVIYSPNKAYPNGYLDRFNLLLFIYEN